MLVAELHQILNDNSDWGGQNLLKYSARKTRYFGGRFLLFKGEEENLFFLVVNLLPVFFSFEKKKGVS